jgi:coenzyme F420-reducing hydrogenase gamma subunit
MATSTAPKPRVGVVKLASCDGCQLTLLDLEEQLLPLTERFELVEFPEATSRRSEGPYDVLLIEGSVSTPEHVEELIRLRSRTRLLVTIGACATSGGIQALRAWADEPAWRAAVYPEPGYIRSLATSTPVADHVQVDAELRGCPIDPGQLVELLTALRVGRRPQLAGESVCLECKRRGTVCVLVASGAPCLGPLTQAGCGAICPAFGRACYACFGPREQANVPSLHAWLATDRPSPDVDRLFAGFTAGSAPFREPASRAVATAQVRPASGAEGPVDA